ncbi:MAG: RHS repeat-associated core domain-containing protein [Bacteroidota bacterium]
MKRHSHIDEWSVATGDYRHLFNGMESDNEVSGNGNSYTTQFRQYDPRLGRWKSLDPLMAKYPNQSPYAAFNNNPVYFVDPLGLEGDPPAGLPEDAEDGSVHEAENGNKYEWIGGEGDEKGFWLETGDDMQILDEVVILADAKNANGTAKSGETSYHLSYNLDGQQYNFYDLTYDEKNTLVADYWQRKWEQQRQSRQKSFWDVHMPTYDIDYNIMPQAITISIEGDASSGVATSSELQFTWITSGDDLSLVPYILYKQKFGGSKPGAGAGISLEASYKSNGEDITANDLVTPTHINNINRLKKYHGREFGGSLGPFQAAYEYTPIYQGSPIHSYSIGVNCNVGLNTVYDASIMSTFTVPLNFGP